MAYLSLWTRDLPLLAANIMAEPSGGGTAFPIALIAPRDEVGSNQFAGNPIIIAVSRTFKQRKVSPSLLLL